MLIVLAAGCVARIPGRNGESHHIIFGFGIVTTNAPAGAHVVASRAHSLGFMITDRPETRVGAGYASSAVVTVADGARDVRVELSQKPGGSLIIDAPSVAFEPPDSKEESP